MKNPLKSFFKKAIQEFGESFEGLDVRDGFAGLIYLSEEHWIDCQISIDEVKIYDSYLDSNHEYMFDAFAEYVQQEMKESILEARDKEETEYRLALTAHW
jgi:hypothetical protein